MTAFETMLLAAVASTLSVEFCRLPLRLPASAPWVTEASCRFMSRLETTLALPLMAPVAICVVSTSVFATLLATVPDTPTTESTTLPRLALSATAVWSTVSAETLVLTALTPERLMVAAKAGVEARPSAATAVRAIFLKNFIK